MEQLLAGKSASDLLELATLAIEQLAARGQWLCTAGLAAAYAKLTAVSGPGALLHRLSDDLLTSVLEQCDATALACMERSCRWLAGRSTHSPVRLAVRRQLGSLCLPSWPVMLRRCYAVFSTIFAWADNRPQRCRGQHGCIN